MDIITGYVGTPHVTAEQDRDINIGIFGNESYVLQTGSQLNAEISSNNEIKIRDGVIMHQGCAASIKKNTYDSLTINNGSQGMKRIDLIVARYQKNKEDGVESLNLKVIQGAPAESNPTVPKYTTGDIQTGDLVADMPLYQVILNGLNVTEVKKLFDVQGSFAKIEDSLITKNYKSNDFHFNSFFQILSFQCYRLGKMVFLNCELYINPGTTILADTVYGFNWSSIPKEILPSQDIFLQGFCCNGDFGNATQIMSYVEHSGGIIKYSLPVIERYIAVQGFWLLD